MDFRTRQAAADIRRTINASRVRPSNTIGSPTARDTAGMASGRGPITAFYDVLDADGNPTFVLGTTGLSDNVNIE